MTGQATEGEVSPAARERESSLWAVISAGAPETTPEGLNVSSGLKGFAESAGVTTQISAGGSQARVGQSDLGCWMRVVMD
jgi:hypothetical protein